MNILGLSGKSGSGKDYLYEHYLQPRGYYRVALADHFKIWAVGQGLATYEEVFVTKPPHIRSVLQRLGTEEGRNVFGNDVWCQTLFAWIHHIQYTNKIDKFCIVDVRFKNEVEYIQRKGGGVVARIHAPERTANNFLTEEQRKHISETDLDTYTTFDFHINNDYADERFVEQKLDDLVAAITYY